MTNKALVVLLEDIIEVIMNNVEDEDQRTEIYDEIIQPFEAAGLDNFEDVLGFDPVFDKIFIEHYPELISDSE